MMLATILAFVMAAKIPVTEDFEKAKKIAEVHERPIVLLFTGSDWSNWSKKLLHDVLENEEFQKSVTNTFVFVKVDFPEANHQARDLMQEHYELKERFDVQDFPCVILLDHEGFEISRLGYVPHEPKEYAKQLLSIYEKYQELFFQIKSSDLSLYKISELERLYNEACKLRSPHLVGAVLQEGISREEGVFFLLEKYSQLFRMGKRFSQEAKALRDLITKRDVNNMEGGMLRLALLDFQANREEAIKSPEEVVEPLQQFILKFKDQEKETLAKLNYMISEYFRSHDVLAKQ
ncbi:MAG: thioredoxin family protein [Chlamydiae bacterium]|nr:thioredoxin family protein [Chlamydiota bacterium]